MPRSVQRNSTSFVFRYLFQGLAHPPWKRRIAIAQGDLLYLNILTILFGNLYYYTRIVRL